MAQLAEKLGITDRAVSKWETGKSMPDSSIMIELCQLLSINVNELLKGEKITMENYGKAAEEMLLELKKRDEEKNKLMLQMEVVVTSVCVVASFINIAVAGLTSVDLITKSILILSGIFLFFFGVIFALKMEQDAGYYLCEKCNSYYQPSYASVLWAPHIGRTRKMKCPHCGKKSWQKKIVTIEK